MPPIPDQLFDLTENEQAELLRLTPENELLAANDAFPEWAHAGQLTPPGEWRTWVLMAGRGFGKTRAGAEWVLACVRGEGLKQAHPRPLFLRNTFGSPQAGGESKGETQFPSRLREGLGVGPSNLRIALVAATVDEARRVMVEGPSGILACAREREIAEWAPARRELHFANGAIATLFSGASPEALRGPQHHLAWCDELAKWRHPEATWDMLQFGLRCGDNPRALVTTTPRGGCAVLGRILEAADTVRTGGSMRLNPHLPPAFVAAAERSYGGTRMGREEIEGELLADVHGSLWPRALIERARGPVPRRDALRRVVVGVDPPASAAGTCGIVVCGLDAAGVGHVLADCSAGGLSPEGWAKAVAAAAEAWDADRVIAEQNQGGEMVEAVLRGAGLRLAVTRVSATRAKSVRAEPVAAQFETGHARLAGRFPALEDELGGMVAGGGPAGAASPDRADAMVWALWALLLAPKGEPQVRLP